MYVNCAGAVWKPEYYDASACVVCDCKLDQFVNGPPVYELVIHFLNCFQLYKAKWYHLETRPNGLKAG